MSMVKVVKIPEPEKPFEGITDWQLRLPEPSEEISPESEEKEPSQDILPLAKIKSEADKERRKALPLPVIPPQVILPAPSVKNEPPSDWNGPLTTVERPRVMVEPSSTIALFWIFVAVVATGTLFGVRLGTENFS